MTAIAISVATGVVSAQAPAGTGQSAAQPAANDQDASSAPENDLGTPRPAGVGSAQAPASNEPASPAQEQGARSDVTRGAAPAAASRPFSGLFGGAAPSTDDRGQTLDLSASIFGAHLDGNSVNHPNAEADILSDGTFNYAGGSASLDYSSFWRHASVGGRGELGTAYVPEYDDAGRDPWVNRWSVGTNAGFNAELTRKLRASGAAQADYSPYYQQDLLFQAALPTIGSPLGTTGLDFVLARSPSITSGVNGSLVYSVSRSGSLEGYYTLSRRDFTSTSASSPFADYYDQRVGGRYVHRINQWMGARAGYGYRTTRLGVPDGPTLHMHQIDAGLDGGRSFELARRTTFSFNTGSSVFVEEQAGFDEGRSRTRWFVIGAADLVHRWARSWSANIGTSRSVDYEIGFDKPLLSNQVYAGMGGLLTRRLDARLAASYVSGAVGFGAGGRGFDTSSVSGSLRWAIVRNLAAYGQYFYYHYSFDSGVPLPVFLQRNLDRQGFSVGLTTWVPLIAGRGRR